MIGYRVDMLISTSPVAVILARGLGTRLRAASQTTLDPGAAAVAETGVKALLPDADGRPFLDHILTDLADAGIYDVVLVIGPEHDVLRDHYARQSLSRLRVTHAIQAQAHGTADAVLAAKAAIAGRDFLVLNSDNRYPVSALAALASLPNPGLVGFRRRGLLQGNLTAERIAKFAVIATEQGRLTQIVEKPSASVLATFGDDPLLSMNCWRGDIRLLTACAQVTPSPRGELELTDAVAHAMHHSCPFQVIENTEPVLDLSCRDDLASVRAALRNHQVRL